MKQGRLKPFEIGVIGAGVAARMASDALTRFDSVAISYIEDIFPDAFSSFTHVDNQDLLFDAEKCSSLYIATPVNTHMPLIQKAISAGIPALVEKPLYLNLEQCTTLEPTSTTKICIAFRKRFSRMAESIREVKAKRKGERCKIRYVWLAPHPGKDHWKLQQRFAGGGVMMDIGSHVLDLFENTIGIIQNIELTKFNKDETYYTDSYVSLNCQFVDGSEGQIIVGWAIAEDIQIVDFTLNDCQISWRKFGGQPYSYLTEILGQAAKTHRCHRSEEYIPMFAEFRKFTKGRGSLIPRYHEGIRNMELISDVYAQMETA